jgi:hypothetical protein
MQGQLPFLTVLGDINGLVITSRYLPMVAAPEAALLPLPMEFNDLARLVVNGVSLLGR